MANVRFRYVNYLRRTRKRRCRCQLSVIVANRFIVVGIVIGLVAGLGLVHSLYRADRAVVPAIAWHLVSYNLAYILNIPCRPIQYRYISTAYCCNKID